MIERRQFIELIKSFTGSNGDFSCITTINYFSIACPCNDRTNTGQSDIRYQRSALEEPAVCCIDAECFGVNHIAEFKCIVDRIHCNITYGGLSAFICSRRGDGCFARSHSSNQAAFVYRCYRVVACCPAYGLFSGIVGRNCRGQGKSIARIEAKLNLIQSDSVNQYNRWIIDASVAAYPRVIGKLIPYFASRIGNLRHHSNRIPFFVRRIIGAFFIRIYLRVSILAETVCFRYRRFFKCDSINVPTPHIAAISQFQPHISRIVQFISGSKYDRTLTATANKAVRLSRARSCFIITDKSKYTRLLQGDCRGRTDSKIAIKKTSNIGSSVLIICHNQLISAPTVI